MKSDLFVSVAFLLVRFFSVGLASCRQETFDLDKKELDPRMVGTWRLIEKGGDVSFPVSETIKFKDSGYCIGLTYPKSRDRYYTEEGNQLFIVTSPLTFEYTGWAERYYYEINQHRLYLWSDREDMLARRYREAYAYDKDTNS